MDESAPDLHSVRKLTSNLITFDCFVPWNKGIFTSFALHYAIEEMAIK